MSLPQTCLHAGADAAVGTMIAYYHRELTGEGQHVDISMQQSTALFLANAVPFWELSGEILKRVGAFRTGMSTDVKQRQVWKCKDGYVFFIMMGGKTGAKTCRELTKWMDSEGMATEYLLKMDWESWDMSTVTQEIIDQISIPIENFFKSHTRTEIFKGTIERNILLCPLFSMEDLLNDTQLKARNFWTEIEHPELNTKITYPREFAKSSEESFAIRLRPPLIGEHNEEIYSEIGLSRKDLVTLKQAGII
jgi:crotonobetainyl-CoA:carnitine CoA-transferase CaiB-like acyl-CoA transferase